MTILPPPAGIRCQFIVASITLLLSALLLFTHLGHYALWDDESLAALIGDGVWHTGDTSAVHGQNIVAYRDGLLIKGLKDRSSPPLQYYIVAPFVGVIGENAWAARLPMAMLGFGCVALMMWWMHRDGADPGTWILFSMALLGNVSFFLYFRQCRYYAPASFLLVATAYCYLHAETRRGIILTALLCLLLLTANYMTWAAAMGMAGVDYIFWGRKRRRLSLADWAIVLLPQVVVGGIVLWIWNPSSIDAGEMRGPWLPDRLTLLWWTLRDLNSCEYGVGILLIAAPFVGFFMKRPWIVRSFTALIVGVLVTVIISPQSATFHTAMQADVRYLCAFIPFCLVVETLTLRALAGSTWAITGVVPAALLFYSNLLQGGLLLDPSVRVPVGSTPWRFVRELVTPPADPYTVTADWINQNVIAGESILVLPEYARYPLIFHAPGAIYAWQLSDPAKDPAYASLPPIDFRDRHPPDYIIGFGRTVQPKRELHLSNIRYGLVQVLNVYALWAYRPELFWRDFEEVRGFDPGLDGIKVYKRM